MILDVIAVVVGMASAVSLISGVRMLMRPTLEVWYPDVYEAIKSAVQDHQEGES